MEKNRADVATDGRRSGGGAVSRSNENGASSDESGRSGGRSRRRGRGRRPAGRSSEASSPTSAPVEDSSPGSVRRTERPREPVPAVPSAVVDPDAPLFDSLGLSAATLEAVHRAGYSQPTPVQAGLIPRAITGIDVLGQARTGTGKTAAFVLPILERMAVEPAGKPGVRALIMVPTRELAVQVRDEFEKLAHGSGVHCVAVYGGKPIKSQIDKLARDPQVVV